MAFDLTANLVLKYSGRQARQTRVDIENALKGINVDVKLKVGKGTKGKIQNLQKALDLLNTSLQKTQALAKVTAADLNKIGMTNAHLASTVSKVEKAQNKAVTSTKKLSKGMDAAATSAGEFGKLSKIALKRFLAFSAATTVVFGFTRALTSSFKRAVEFETEMIKIAQVLKRPVESLGQLNSQITKLSTSLGVSSSELVGVARTLAQTGMSMNEVNVAMAALAKTDLSPTFGKMSDSAEGMIATMGQFGIKAKDWESALGSMNAVASRFAVESGDIVTAVRKAGAAFQSASPQAQSGLQTFQQFIAAFTSIRATTRQSADVIATGLKTISTRIRRPETIKYLEDLGIAMRNAKGEFVGVAEAFNRIGAALAADPGGLGNRMGDEFGILVEKLGGFRQVQNVIPLLTQMQLRAQALAVAQAGVNSMSDDVAEAMKGMGRQSATVSEKWDALIRNFQRSGAIRTTINLMLDLANALLRVAEAIEPLIPALMAMGAVQGGRMLFGGAKGRRPRGLAGGFAQGGMIGGIPGKDKNLAAVTKGEFVVSKKGVASVGVPALNAINSGLPRFASGGFFSGHSMARKQQANFNMGSGMHHAIGGGGLFRLPRTTPAPKAGLPAHGPKTPGGGSHGTLGGALKAAGITPASQAQPTDLRPSPVMVGNATVPTGADASKGAKKAPSFSAIEKENDKQRAHDRRTRDINRKAAETQNRAATTNSTVGKNMSKGLRLKVRARALQRSVGRKLGIGKYNQGRGGMGLFMGAMLAQQALPNQRDEEGLTRTQRTGQVTAGDRAHDVGSSAVTGLGGAAVAAMFMSNPWGIAAAGVGLGAASLYNKSKERRRQQRIDAPINIASQLQGITAEHGAGSAEAQATLAELQEAQSPLFVPTTLPVALPPGYDASTIALGGGGMFSPIGSNRYQTQQGAVKHKFSDQQIAERMTVGRAQLPTLQGMAQDFIQQHGITSMDQFRSTPGGAEILAAGQGAVVLSTDPRNTEAWVASRGAFEALTSAVIETEVAINEMQQAMMKQKNVAEVLDLKMRRRAAENRGRAADIADPFNYDKFKGLNEPMVTSRFGAAVDQLGLSPDEASVVKGANRFTQAGATFFSQQSGTFTEDSFQGDIKTAVKRMNLPQVLEEHILGNLGAMEWEDVLGMGAEQLTAELLGSFGTLTSSAQELGDALNAAKDAADSQLANAFSQGEALRNASLKFRTNAANVANMKRARAGLPPWGTGSVADSDLNIRRAAGEGVQGTGVLPQHLNTQDLANQLAFQREKHRQNPTRQGEIIIDALRKRLEMLADSTSRLKTAQDELGRAMEGLDAKRGLLAGFFGTGKKGRMDMLRGAASGSRAFSNLGSGGLLNMSTDEQQAAVGFLSGQGANIQNIFGSGMTGQELLNKLLDEAGMGFMKPEKDAAGAARDRMIKIAEDALLAEQALLEDQKRGFDNVVAALTTMNSNIVNAFGGVEVGGMADLTGMRTNATRVPNVPPPATPPPVPFPTTIPGAAPANAAGLPQPAPAAAVPGGSTNQPAPAPVGGAVGGPGAPALTSAPVPVNVNGNHTHSVNLVVNGADSLAVSIVNQLKPQLDAIVRNSINTRINPITGETNDNIA